VLKIRMSDGLVMLGLEPADVEYITEDGEPIVVTLQDIGYPGMEVVLFYGASHEAMLDTLRKNGIDFVN
jgi:hypothetical protein